MPLPKRRRRTGLELKFKEFKGRFCDLFCKVCPFFFFIIVKYADFRNSHPTIEFETEAGIRFYTVVDVIKTDIYDKIYNQIKADDNTLILSTCYGTAKSGRLLIIAKEATG